MLKSKIIISGILLVIVIFFLFKYNNYSKKLILYQSILSYDIDNAYKEYRFNVDKSNITKDHFEEYFKNKTFNVNKLFNQNYNILVDKDSIFIYEFGFDNMNDNFTRSYLVKNSSFINSLFLKGDVLIYKNSIILNNLKVRKEIIVKTFDTIPPPPILIPQRVLDSLNSIKIDSIDRLNFINNYGNVPR